MLIPNVEIPDGQRGMWTVKRFTVSEEEAKWACLRASIKGGRGMITPGSYTKLVHAQRGLVMSDTPDEKDDHYSAVSNANGHCLINGLGLGMVLNAILKKPDVNAVTVVDIDQDIIDLVGPHYADPRLEIVHFDAFSYQPPKGIRYGMVWHDIWDHICSDNLPQMTKLKRKYGRRCEWQGCWAEYHCRLGR